MTKKEIVEGLELLAISVILLVGAFILMTVVAMGISSTVRGMLNFIFN